MSHAPLRGYLPFFAAADAARFFLHVARDCEGQLSHRQLQNLLYYGQGFSLVLFGKLLFEEPIEARSEGPIVAEVAREFPAHGDGPVSLEASFSPTGETRLASSLTAERVVHSIYRGFGQVNCTELTRQIMSEQPFRRATSSDGFVEPGDLLRWWIKHLERERGRRSHRKPVQLRGYLARRPQLAKRLQESNSEADENRQ